MVFEYSIDSCLVREIRLWYIFFDILVFTIGLIDIQNEANLDLIF